MRPISENLPKTLITLQGRTVLKRILDQLCKAGIQDITIVVSQNGLEQIRQEVNRYEHGVLEVRVVLQGGAEDIRGAAMTGLDSAFEHVGRRSTLLTYGDIVAGSGFYESLFETGKGSGYPAASVVLRNDPRTYGVATLTPLSTIAAVRDKAQSPDPRLGTYVLGGAFVLPPGFQEFLESKGSFTEALDDFAKSYTVAASVWGGSWTDLGYPWDIISATSAELGLLQNSSISSSAKVSPTAILEPPVIVEEGVVIDHHAVIKGPAYLGKDVYVGTGALIHNNSSLEEGVVVGAYAEISNSVLQPHTSVGRGCFVGNSVTGRHVVFEPHVVTLNLMRRGPPPDRLESAVKEGRFIFKIGAMVGGNARIGANSVLHPGTSIAHGSTLAPNTVNQ